MNKLAMRVLGAATIACGASFGGGGVLASGASKPGAAVPPPPPAAPTSQQVAAGVKAFAQIQKVVQSPRCRNCHPAGDIPLQTDLGRPHRMNISRLTTESGLACKTCHQERNSEALGVPGGPPGAPHWGLPPKETPMIFEGRKARALCEQLKDPKRNGQRSLHDLLKHVTVDPLILWAWNPGGKRTKPPMSHQFFVAAFATWVDSNGACP